MPIPPGWQKLMPDTLPPARVQVPYNGITPRGPLAHLHDHNAMVSTEGEVWAQLSQELRRFDKKKEI